MHSLTSRRNQVVKSYSSQYPAKIVMSTVLTKSSSAKVHSKRPYSDHSVQVGQLIPRFILSLSRLGKRRSRSTSWQKRFRRVAFGVESNVGAPIAIYEGAGAATFVLARSRAILVRRRTTIDSFGSIVIPGHLGV